MENVKFDEWLNFTLSEQELPVGIDLTKDINTDNMTTAFDQERLRRVIVNVFNNACEAMIEATENGEIDHPLELNVATKADAEHLEVTFADNGPGIQEDVLKNIFEPLYSTKSFGVGLGLPTVKQIMEQHDGGIEITSSYGAGTQVRLWLPIKQVQEKAA